MKKFLALILAMAMVFCLAACGEEAPAEEVAEAPAEAPAEEAAEEPAEEAAEETEFPEVMSHEEFIAAELETPVTVETYVQAKQGWWEKDGVGGVATLYTQDENGAYFIYDALCSEEVYEQLVPGTKILVKGYKAEWSGEVEIIDASIEVIEGSFIAEAADITELLGAEDLIAHQNEFVTVKGLTVEDKGEGKAFLYNYDGSGEQGNDLYFDVSLNGQTYTFVVESYLCGADSDVYKAVEALKVGDVIDVEGFLYWYENAQLHTTAITVK